MFYQHSSLLERAGKLASNHKTLTTIPMVFAAGGDITSYLPTNVMSITDGQWILDMKVFRDTMRPAVSVGLSVSRVGGRGQSERHKKLGGQTFKTLTAHAEAQEFARFGSELAVEAQQALARGGLLYKMLNQVPGERYTLMAQTLMLDILLGLDEKQSINLENLKQKANEAGAKVTSDDKFEAVRDELRQQSMLETGKETPKPEAAKPETDASPDAKPAEEAKAPEEAKK
jgi:F-type H+-transporting ATPase subunit alpha